MSNIDKMLSEMDEIIADLKIPTDTPRFIKSQAYNRNYKAIQFWNYGKPEKAKELFLQCIDDFKTLNAPADEAMIYNNLGLIYLMKGEFHGAINYFEKTLDYFQDKPNVHLVATLLNNIGEAYREIGNIPQALNYHQETLKIRLSIGDEPEIAQSYLFLGSLFMDQGRLEDALDNFTESLKVYKQINHELNIARVLFKIGEIFLDRGQFDQAEDYYNQSISYLKQSGNPVIFADCYMSLGLIHREKGDFEQSLVKFQEASNLREELGNQVLFAISQCEMVECHVLQRQPEIAIDLLNKIKSTVVNYPEHKILHISYKFVEAIYYQHSNRSRDRTQAELIYREILDLPIIPYKLEVRATKQLIKLLLEELKNYGQEEVLLELLDYIDKLETLAKRQSLVLLLVEIYLIRHQLQLLLGQSQPSSKYLDQASELVQTLNVPILSQKVNEQITFYDRNMELWKGLDQLNLMLSDKLKLSIISSTLQNSQDLLHLYQKDIGRSILVIVFGEGGTISFSYHFNSNQSDVQKKINPHLIASFISALNSFGKDTFETSDLIETMTYGQNKLISRRINSYIVSLLYEGTKLRVHQQLIEFETFLRESGIIDFIKTHPRQEFRLENDHIEIIERIFN